MSPSSIIVIYVQDFSFELVLVREGYINDRVTYFVGSEWPQPRLIEFPLHELGNIYSRSPFAGCNIGVTWLIQMEIHYYAWGKEEKPYSNPSISNRKTNGSRFFYGLCASHHRMETPAQTHGNVQVKELYSTPIVMSQSCRELHASGTPWKRIQANRCPRSLTQTAVTFSLSFSFVLFKLCWLRPCCRMHVTAPYSLRRTVLANRTKHKYQPNNVSNDQEDDNK